MKCGILIRMGITFIRKDGFSVGYVIKLNYGILKKMRMDKPSTMSIKEHIYRKISQELEVPHATIKKVLDNQFRTALSAMKGNNSLEIAGFGKFHINKTRLKDEIKKLEYHIIHFNKKLLTEEDPLERENFQEYLKIIPGRLAELKIRAKKLKIKLPSDEPKID